MPSRSIVQRHWIPLLAASAVLIVVGGLLIAMGGSESSPPAAGGVTVPNDTDPQVIGSGGQPPTATTTPSQSVEPRTTPTATRTPTRTPSRFPTPTPGVATATPPPNASAGPHLSIPTISVYAHVESRSTDANNVMQSPEDPHNVAWYDFTAPPGTLGNAVFAGHVDYVGLGKTVFGSLAQLKPGDEVQYITLEGVTLRYRVTRTAIAASTDAANQYVGPTTTEMVTLITCIGDFDRPTLSYNQRLVVQAERIP